MKTAPKNEHILLRYPSFCDDGTFFVNQGHWVEVPPHGMVSNLLIEGRDWEIPKPPYDGHWEISYVALLEGTRSGRSFETKSFRVEPTHWKPLPSSSLKDN